MAAKTNWSVFGKVGVACMFANSILQQKKIKRLLQSSKDFRYISIEPFCELENDFAFSMLCI